MIYNNEDSVRFLKSFIMICGLGTIVIMSVLIFLQQFLWLALVTGFFLFGLIIISILNFQYIFAGINQNKLIIRYYSVFQVNRNYQSIEFPIDHLLNIRVKKYLFGLKWDLRFTVKTRQGIADYPPVSLSAVSFRNRKVFLSRLNLLIPASLTNK